MSPTRWSVPAFFFAVAHAARNTSFCMKAPVRIDSEMRTRSSYNYIPRSGETSRSFEITATHISNTPLRILNSSAEFTTTRAAGTRQAMVRYQLSSEATSRVEVRSNGHTVRRLATGRAAGKGLNEVLWDLRDDQGRSLPAGLYTVEISALGTSGEQSRSIVPLIISR